MPSVLLFISSGLFLSVVLYIGLIIWDRNRIWSLLSNDISGWSKSSERERPSRRIFDGSSDS